MLTMKRNGCSPWCEMSVHLGAKYAVGAVGVLLLAKQHGHILAVKPSMDRLVANGYFISPRLYQMVLVRAGETP